MRWFRADQKSVIIYLGQFGSQNTFFVFSDNFGFISKHSKKSPKSIQKLIEKSRFEFFLEMADINLFRSIRWKTQNHQIPTVFKENLTFSNIFKCWILQKIFVFFVEIFIFILKIYFVVLDDLNYSLEKMISIIISYFPNEFGLFKSLLKFSFFRIFRFWIFQKNKHNFHFFGKFYIVVRRPMLISCVSFFWICSIWILQ